MKKIVMSLALLALAAVSSLTMAAGEVSLVKAVSQSSYYHGYSWEDGRFEALVANLGYTKNVTAYLKKADGNWVDYPLSYARSTGGNKEVWAADFHNTSWSTSSLPNTGSVIEFVIKYQVNGQTYWDNNSNANYKLPHGAGTLLGKGVNVSLADYAADIKIGQATSFPGHITVRNLGYAKDVKITYSTDNWATTKVAVASYQPYWTIGYSTTANPNSMGFEEWFFNLDVGYATQVVYAVSYTVNGQTYWDNNSGLNYSSRLVR